MIQKLLLVFAYVEFYFFHIFLVFQKKSNNK